MGFMLFYYQDNRYNAGMSYICKSTHAFPIRWAYIWVRQLQEQTVTIKKREIWSSFYECQVCSFPQAVSSPLHHLNLHFLPHSELIGFGPLSHILPPTHELICKPIHGSPIYTNHLQSLWVFHIGWEFRMQWEICNWNEKFL